MNCDLNMKYLEGELVDIVSREYVLSDRSEVIFYAVDVMWIPMILNYASVNCIRKEVVV